MAIYHFLHFYLALDKNTGLRRKKSYRDDPPQITQKIQKKVKSEKKILYNIYFWPLGKKVTKMNINQAN